MTRNVQFKPANRTRQIPGGNAIASAVHRSLRIGGKRIDILRIDLNGDCLLIVCARNTKCAACKQCRHGEKPNNSAHTHEPPELGTILTRKRGRGERCDGALRRWAAVWSARRPGTI